MFAIATPHKTTRSLAEIPRLVSIAWVALAARVSARRSEPVTAPWHSLDERLLRDIGASSAEAEVARTQRALGRAGGRRA